MRVCVPGGYSLVFGFSVAPGYPLVLAPQRLEFLCMLLGVCFMAVKSISQSVMREITLSGSMLRRLLMFVLVCPSSSTSRACRCPHVTPV